MTDKQSHSTRPSYAAIFMTLGAILVMLLGADGGPRALVPPNLDQAAQRSRMQDELVSLNAKMDELIRLLKSGNVKVVCIQDDNDGRGVNRAIGANETIIRPSEPASSPSGDAR